MPHILPTWAKETTDEETGNYYPVFHNAFVRSAQSVKTKRFTAHTLEETFYCLQARSVLCSLFYFLLLGAGGDFSSDNFNILCSGTNWYCTNITVFPPVKIPVLTCEDRAFVCSECIHSPYTLGSVDPAVDAGFSLLTSGQVRLHFKCKRKTRLNTLISDVFPSAFLFLLLLVRHIIQAQHQ